MTTPVNKVTGVGPKTVEYLKERRITTAEALVKRGTSVLETAPGFSPGRAENVIHAANKLLHGEAIIGKTASKPKVDKSKQKKKDKKEKKKDKDKKSKNKKHKKDKKTKKDNKPKKKKGKKNKK